MVSSPSGPLTVIDSRTMSTARVCSRTSAPIFPAVAWCKPAASGRTAAARPGALEPLTRNDCVTTIQVMTTQSLAAVKAHFSRVIDEVASTHERVTVTKNGSPVAVILAVEDYESLMETLEILSDPKAIAEIRQAAAQMREGEVHDEAEVRAALAARRG